MGKIIRTALIYLALSSWLSADDEIGLQSPPKTEPFLNKQLPASEPGPTGSWTTINAFPELPLEDPVDSSFIFEPVYLTGAPRSNQLYVCDKKGKIWTFPNQPNVSEKSLFLDISDRVKTTPNAGLGTIVFHPDFGLTTSPNRDFVFLHYFWSPDPKQTGPKNQAPDSQDELPLSGYWRLSRFTVQAGQNKIDPASENILIQQYDPHHWHNGGSMFFDKEGFLYLSSGDIGADKNYYKAGQTLSEGLFGTILRIDVDCRENRSHPIRRQPTDHDEARKTKPKTWTEKSFSQGYFIPNDNPWIDEAGGILEEFWCIGIRSPHRMSYDLETEQIWVGDVGQFRKEEINFIIKGGNYQWPYKDGTLTGYDKKPATLIGSDQPPIHEYTHTANGAAVIGGHVYRGYEHRKDLEGKYLFSEHQGGQIWTLQPASVGGKIPKVERLTTIKGCGFHNGPSSFGQDNQGELHICVLKRNSKEKAIPGEIVKLARTQSTTNPEAPDLLSKTGVLSDCHLRTPSPHLIPYAPSSPFWSDGAIKTRYMAIPSANTIQFSPTDNWSFPKGTVFIKHFDYPVDDRDPLVRIPIETRLLVHGSDGHYFGFTYQWNDEGTDAKLLTSGSSREIQIHTVDGGVRHAKWEFPSRSECMQCHTAAAGQVLGVRTHQLNSPFTYSQGVSSNQLLAWNHVGLFDKSFDPNLISSYPASHSITDKSVSLKERVRSYLDSNCSHCHRPGAAYAGFDARFTTPLAEQGLINGGLIRNYGIEGQSVIHPGDVSKSILYQRLNSAGEEKMPPITKHLVDLEAATIVREWIESLKDSK